MSNTFKQFIQKVGSGSHTSDNLTRDQAATATKMMLLGEATPIQIGAFLIAHRIKRPTGEELAGMLDTYHELALWNGGFYLWRSGICPDMQAGIDKAAELITSGLLAAKLHQIKMFLG